MKPSSKRLRALIIPIQAAISIIILYLLLRNLNFAQTYQTLQQINIPTLLLSVIFCILGSFAIGFALHGALKSLDAAPPFYATQMANFGGQLLSDITPAKSGYFATPILLNQLKAVPIEKGIASTMAVGAINFFIKATFSTLALIYFLTRIHIDPAMVNAMLIGITLLLAGGIGLTIIVWTDYFSTWLQKLSKIPLIGNIIKKLNNLRATFTQNKTALQKSAKTTIPAIIASILLSTASLYILAQAIGLTQPTFQDLLFMGPLSAVFMYVPVTFAGLGLTEAANVFILTSIGAPLEIAIPYTLISRLIGISTDLLGLPPLIKTSNGILNIFYKNKTAPQIKPK